MKINSINTAYNYNNKYNTSFKRTAVPYPEYRAAYNVAQKNSVIDTLINKISNLFSPEVTKEAVNIKKNIDTVFETSKKNLKPHKSVSAEQALISVLA